MITIDDRDDNDSINDMHSPEHRSSRRSSADLGLSEAEPLNEGNHDAFLPTRMRSPTLFMEEILDSQNDFLDAYLKENLTTSPLSPRNVFLQIQNKRFHAASSIVPESSFNDEIVSIDIPERLFRRGYTFNRPEIKLETMWVFNRMSARNKDRMIDESMREDIGKTLDMLLNKNYEIMYIHTYQRWNFKSQISLDELWEIYVLDLEYQLIEFKRAKVRKKLEKMVGNEHPEDNFDIILKLLDNQLELKGLKSICEGNLRVQSNDNAVIDDLEQWLLYISKAKELQEVSRAAYPILLSPKQVAHNITVQHLYRPGHCDQDPESFFRNQGLETINSSNPKGKETTLKVCKALALSLSNDPIILISLRKIAQQYHAFVSTEPTLKGNSELNIYHPNYLTKRLTNVPIHIIEDELWLRILEAEKNEQILVKIHVGWPSDADPTSLFRILYKFFGDNEQKSHDPVQIAWCNARKEVIRILTEELFPPYYTQFLRTQKTNQAEQNFVKQIAEKFRGMIDRNLLALDSLKESSQEFYVCALAPNPDTEKEYSVAFVDHNGILKFSENFIYNKLSSELDLRVEVTKEIRLIRQKVRELKPIRVFLADNQLTPLEVKLILRGEIREMNPTEDIDINILYVDGVVPQRIARDRIDKEFQHYSEGIREAISVVRQILDPLSEIAKLWSEDPKKNRAIVLPLHDLIKTISPHKLHTAFETVLLEYTSIIGTDLQEFSRFDHHDAKAQFICGFGALKAKDFIKKIKELGRSIKSREEIQMLGWLPSKVEEMMLGFIRFDRSPSENKISPLDATRIHPLDYNIAFEFCGKMAAYWGTPIADSDDKIDIVEKVIEKARKLGIPKYTLPEAEDFRFKLKLISEEILAPFANHLKKTFKPDEIFYTLCDESPSHLRSGMLVDGTIEQILTSDMRVKLSCNLEVEINSLSVLEHDQKRHNTKLSDFFFEGKPVMIRILSLEFAEYGTFVENRDPSKLAKISVSMKESEVNKHRVYLNKLHSDRKYFMVKEEDDFPPPIKYYPRSQSFKPRNIRHPFFKNVTEEEARAWLDKFCDGAFIIRPHSRKEGYLRLTWKQSRTHHGNFEIIERMRDKGQKEYVIKYPWYQKEESFRTFDEIKSTFIDVLNEKVKSVRGFERFCDEDARTLKSKLEQEFRQHPAYMPYYFCFHSKPMLLWLLYVTKKGTVMREFAEITPDGFRFHDANFMKLKWIVDYLKENFKTPRYQKYIATNKAPPEEIVEDEESQRIEMFCDDTGLANIKRKATALANAMEIQSKTDSKESDKSSAKPEAYGSENHKASAISLPYPRKSALKKGDRDINLKNTRPVSPAVHEMQKLPKLDIASWNDPNPDLSDTWSPPRRIEEEEKERANHHREVQSQTHEKELRNKRESKLDDSVKLESKFDLTNQTSGIEVVKKWTTLYVGQSKKDPSPTAWDDNLRNASQTVRGYLKETSKERANSPKKLKEISVMNEYQDTWDPPSPPKQKPRDRVEKIEKLRSERGHTVEDKSAFIVEKPPQISRLVDQNIKDVKGGEDEEFGDWNDGILTIGYSMMAKEEKKLEEKMELEGANTQNWSPIFQSQEGQPHKHPKWAKEVVIIKDAEPLIQSSYQRDTTWQREKHSSSLTSQKSSGTSNNKRRDNYSKDRPGEFQENNRPGAERPSQLQIEKQGGSNAFSESKYSKRCHNCNKEGHFARVCPEGAKNKNIRRERRSRSKERSSNTSNVGAATTWENFTQVSTQDTYMGW